MRDFKRILAIGDLHCGHLVGLTHPDFDSKPRSGARKKFYDLRRRYWDFYQESVYAIKPVDVVIVNGDAIDGKGDKSGGTEHLTIDRDEQCDMAVAAIEECEADKIFMTFGTPYHVGVDDWELQVFRTLKERKHQVKIGGHDYINANGLTIDYRHKVGSSAVEYGRHTAVAKARVDNLLWAEHDEFPKAQIILRSHVHYFRYEGGFGWLGMTLPALQGLGAKYGVRECDGTVDFGVVWFDVYNKQEFSWEYRIAKDIVRQRSIKV